MSAPRSLSHTQAVVLMVVVTFLWSTAGVVSRLLESAARFEITFLRSAFTALSLGVMLPMWRHTSRDAAAQPRSRRSVVGHFLHRHWGVLPESRAFWLSGACWGVMFTAFMLALTYTSVANVLIILAAGPLFTALMARLTIGQHLPLRTWLAIVVAGLGILYMYGSQMLAAFHDEAVSAAGLVMGSLVALCVPVAGAINWTVVQRSQSHGERIDLVPSVLLGAVVSLLLTLPLALPLTATASDVGWLAMLGLFQLAIPCALSVVCARVLKAPEISLLALLEVIFGILLAWGLAHEKPAPEVLLGGSLVIGALLVNELLGWRSRTGTPRIQTLNQSTP